MLVTDTADGNDIPPIYRCFSLTLDLRVMLTVRQFREWHKVLAPIVLLPMLVTVFTGVTYRLAKDWFGMTRDQVHWLMVIHEGEYFGKVLEPVYVLLNGLGLLWMVITGSVLLLQSLKIYWRKLKALRKREASSDS